MYILFGFRNCFHAALEAELEVSKDAISRHDHELEELESKASKRVQDACNEEWQKNSTLNNEK